MSRRQFGRLVLVFCFFLRPCFVVQPAPNLASRRTARSMLRAAPAQAAPRDAGDEVIRFGKYKGEKTLRQVVEEDKKYARWIVDNMSQQPWAQPLISYIQVISRDSADEPPVSSEAALEQKLTRKSSAIPKEALEPVPEPATEIPEGPNGDFYSLPKNLLEDLRLWACPGKTWNDQGKPFVYNMKRGWRFVGNVIKRKRLAVNLRDGSLLPDPALNCEELDESDLNELEYARYISALLEEEGRQDPGDSREIYHKGGRLEVTAKLRFRGVALSDGPYVAPALEQELFAPKEWNLGKQTAMASLVGLKVQPLGPSQRWFEGLIVCNESMKAAGLTVEEQNRLLAMTKTPEVKSATKQAELGEPVLVVSRNCSSKEELKLSYVASALRPCLSGQEEKLRQVKGFEDWRNLPPAKLVLSPAERQRMIQAQVARLGAKLFGAKAPGIRRLVAPKFFHQLKEPTLHFSTSSMSANEKPSRMLWKLKQDGAYEVRKDAKDGKDGKVRLKGIIFGPTARDEVVAVEEILRSMQKLLRSFGIPLTAEPEILQKPGLIAQEVREALVAAELNSSDAVLFFQSSSMKPGAVSKFYDRAKYECLRSSSGGGQHIASQWFDLSKRNVWRVSQRSFSFAVDIAGIALLAKLGHTPWAISAKHWAKPTQDAAFRPAVVGYDVCHLNLNIEKTSRRHHVAAGIRVESGDASEPMILSRVSFQTERVHAETVPSESLRRLIPADFARGKLLIVHRDGEFPHSELASLERYHAELHAEDPETAFILVECVKWAGGSPRLYDGKKNALPGTMFAFHDKEVLLSSTKELFQGTSNPINVRLAKVLGVPEGFALQDFAWVQSVYDLSYLHHGSPLRRPRLPITTHFADRLAYVLASAGEDGTDWDRELAEVSAGNQQFWL